METELEKLLGNKNVITSQKIKDLLAELIKKETKPKEKVERSSIAHPKDGPCLAYLTVERTTCCLHCGSRRDSLVHLKQKESISFLQRTGEVKTVVALKYIKEPIKMESWTVSCPSCPSHIKKLSKEELEQAYMFLLSE